MATAPLFGIVIPGRPLHADFQLIDNTKAITMVPYPTAVSEITFFLFPSTIIPPNYGAILYYSIPPFQQWELLGSIDPEKPSGVFRTGWATMEEMQNVEMVQIGVSLEPLENIQNLTIRASGVEDRFNFARHIAYDLFHYMTSFSKSYGSSTDMMVVPTNIFDRWMERFERKYKLDPNFMMKQQD